LTRTAPLTGSVVLSVGHSLPGLYCIAMLRDLGAEIVRIERPGRGETPYAELRTLFPTRSLTTGTHSVALDLKLDAGREAFERLAREAGAILEGFRPGVAARLGIDYERLSRDHPSLVYASLSGYGQTGAARDRVGHDLNYLAETGALGLSNPRGLPGTTFADGLAGASAALNVVAAMHAVARSGAGQHLDLAIVDGPLFLMATELEALWASGAARTAGDTHLTGRHPWYAVHSTRDGGAVALGAVEPASYARLCRSIGHPELERHQHADGEPRAEAWTVFREFFARRTRDEAMTELAHGDACASPVLSIAEVSGSALMERATRDSPSGGEKLVRSPIRLPVPELREERHGAHVLARFGFSDADIEGLAGAGVLGAG
jgi:alpha-methylacyl-CoA racemase